jgi:ATP-dependent Clp protease adaptor protein ClpS
MSQANDPQQEQQGGLLLEATRAEAVPPGRFQLILLNDDFTPMDFVVHVLQEFFTMNQEMATQVMLQIHTRGRGVCGVYSREVAESKLNQVNDFSRQNHHPLLCIMEPL